MPEDLTLAERVERLEEKCDLLLLVLSSYLVSVRVAGRHDMSRLVDAIKLNTAEPTRENYLAALAALDEVMDVVVDESVRRDL